jgi:hypothetical protein
LSVLAGALALAIGFSLKAFSGQKDNK